jgi:alkylation response protein AidB-like acyl-CoA dehydrogenase
MDAEGTHYSFMGGGQDLLEYAPVLKVMKKRFPSYVRHAEETQAFSRRFAREVMEPIALETDARCAQDPSYVDWDFYARAMEHHIPSSFIPVKLGGNGWGCLDLLVFVEEGCAACYGLTALIVFNMFGFLCACVEFMPGNLLRMMKHMVEEEKKGNPVFFSWAITEPGGGTDVEHPAGMAKMRPSIEAKKVPGGYVLNGTKCFITNGNLANFICVNAPLDRSRPLETDCTFMVPATSEGFSPGRVELKCGQKACPTAELLFDNVFVPEENLWAPEGEGMRHTQEILSFSRGGIGCGAVGLARGVVERTVRYASEKKINGHRLIDEAWVQFALAGIMTEIIELRHAWVNFAVAIDFLHLMKMINNPVTGAALKVTPGGLLRADWLEDLAGIDLVGSIVSGLKKQMVSEEAIENFIRHGSALKADATDLAVRAASTCADIVGLEGMARRHGIEKCFRDAKVAQIYEGTNQINRLDVFEREVGYRVG